MPIDYSVLALPKGKPKSIAKDERVCGFCDLPIVRSNDERKSSFLVRKYCSRACMGKAAQARAKTRRPANCEHCHKPFISITGAWRRNRWAKYCSEPCRRAVLSRRPQFLTAKCTMCSATFKRTAAALKRVRFSFCSQQCRSAYFVDDRSPVYRGDKDPNRGARWNRLADTIRSRDNFQCRRCQCSQEENGQKLSVDHVRPWRSFTDKALANHHDNLAALCRKCHSYKTTTVESAWLRGDVIAWKQWIASLNLPSAKFGWIA